MQKETILGVDVCPYNYKQLMQEVDRDIKEKKKSFCVAINPEKIMKAQDDPELKELLNKATYQIPDGIGVIVASKLTKGNITERITGVDLMLHLCTLAAEKGYKVFLYGAKPGVANMAKQELEKQYNGIQIVGTIDGYEKDDEKVVQAINRSGADILFVAKGSPTQELWILEHMNRVNASIYQGVGGSFDVISGQVKRAPRLFQKFGIEWLYRLLSEPKRVKRQLALPLFMIQVLKSIRR
ncbi:WecB/TagA/CpsF family glycosyltransferase [Halalkalibacter okhensis]|uniref:N-acetylglucosaminyldiphosphoundecaprenol N-acetyl-beta-D-mannosaminyltransferase n=1 Tax=Halalkalibacter okhensis TaxID=333138 RepID=A0A0B0IIU5_9BACI|nr:WecB/TagA/CpsF family glycosyltransferase [Halalkalibacter okhensis]KHF39596.1 N-acetylmannosaminyltransferase [Halalkalibacter okhensis]